jgi:hypothetical protein
MFPLDTAGLEGAAAAAVLKALAAAGSHGWRWWEVRRRLSANHKQGRVLYAEILYNLFICRAAQRAHPPELLLRGAEWARPTTGATLASLVSIEDVVLVAAPYMVLEAHERTFGKSWLDLLPLRTTGQDVLIIGRLYDQFAEAEKVLRRKLFSAKGQAAMAAAIQQNPSAPKIQIRTRLANVYWSIPPGWRLAAAMALGLPIVLNVRRKVSATKGRRR